MVELGQRGKALEDDASRREFRVRFDADGRVLGHSVASRLGEEFGILPDDAEETSIGEYIQRLSVLDASLPPRLERRTRKLLELHEEFSLNGDVLIGETDHHIRISGQAIRNLDGTMSFTLLFVDDTEHTHRRRLYEYMFRLANHELKGPLSAIIGAAEFAQEHLNQGSVDGVRSCLDMIERNAEVIDEMILRYLNLSRIESGLIKINASDILVSRDVLDPILSQMEVPFAKKRMRVEFECHGFDHEPLVHADAEKVDIVLRNLLSNALKYGTASTPILVYIGPREDQVEISVENQGPNIPQEHLTKLFGRFVRLDATQGTKGSGLGLYNARKVVEMWGGSIQVKSTDEATRFYFTLPLAKLNAGE